MLSPQLVMPSIVHPVLASPLPCELVVKIADLLGVKELGRLCMASRWFNDAVCSTRRLQKEFIFPLRSAPCVHDGDDNDNAVPDGECQCDHHRFVAYWRQVVEFAQWNSQHAPWSLLKCVTHLRVDVMRFTHDRFGPAIGPADGFPVSLDLISAISGLPALRNVEVHFGGRYYRHPWPQPLTERNEEEAAHVRRVEDFCSTQGIQLQVMGRETIETVEPWY